MKHSRLTLRLVVLTFSGLAGAAVRAQSTTASPTFEVASVKPNRSGDNRSRSALQAGGLFTATNATLVQLIEQAYQIESFRLVGEPTWARADRFDISAKAPDQVVASAPNQRDMNEKTYAVINEKTLVVTTKPQA